MNRNLGLLLKNLLGIAAVIIALVLFSSLILHLITRHGQEIIVPDFSNMTYEEAVQVAGEAGVRVVESDSVYIRQMRRGGIFAQNPKAGSTVKRGRRIQLTVNSRVSRDVTMPSLVGGSLLQAMAELRNKGLVLGRLTYEPDIATNTVLRQKYRGVDVKPGRRVKVGSTIDLVLGVSPSYGRTGVPSLNGLNFVQAVDEIHGASLNVGRLVFDKTIHNYADSLKAQVCMQSPESGSNCPLGASVNITLSLKESE